MKPNQNIIILDYNLFTGDWKLLLDLCVHLSCVFSSKTVFPIENNSIII